MGRPNQEHVLRNVIFYEQLKFIVYIARYL